MFIKINGACSLNGLKFSSSCSLGAKKTGSNFGNKSITLNRDSSPLIESHKATDSTSWLSKPLKAMHQAASNGAAWIKNTYKSCSIQTSYQTNAAARKKTAVSFKKTLTPAVPLDHSHQFAQATISFANELCAKLAATQPAGQSFAISPVSLLAALGMCLNLIQKEKQPLFIEKIGLGQLSVEEANSVISIALKKLLLPESFKDGSIEIAQSLAARPDIEFDPQFLELLKDVYSSELLVSDHLPTLINQWVTHKTHGKITKVLSEDSQAIFALVNATYLNLNWQKKFKKPEEGWPVQQFLCADNTTAPVSMMSQKGNYPLFENDSFSMLEVPYKAPDGRQLSQLIFLPKPNCSLEEIEASMNAEMIRHCRKAAQHEYGIYWKMPKVNAESSLSLRDILISMNLPLSHLDNSKFSKDVEVDSVIHKTVVANSEEGTIAAAVTAVVMIESACPTDPKNFIVDRAYAYLIMDKDTILFRGRVSDATSLTVDKE